MPQDAAPLVDLAEAEPQVSPLAEPETRESPYGDLALVGVVVSQLLPWWISGNGTVSAIGPWFVLVRTGSTPPAGLLGLTLVVNLTLGLPFVIAAVLLGVQSAFVRFSPETATLLTPWIEFAAAVLAAIGWPIGALWVMRETRLPFLAGNVGAVHWYWWLGQLIAVIATLLSIAAAVQSVHRWMLRVHLLRAPA